MRYLILPFLFALITFCQDSMAVEPGAALYGEVSALWEDESPTLRTGHDALRPLTDAMSSYFAAKDKLHQAGVTYSIEYAPQFQWDLDGAYTANDETNFILQLAPLDPAEPRRGSLIAWYQISRTMGDLTTSAFMERVGIVSPVNGGDTAPDSYRDLLQTLVWEQWFLDDRLRFGVGKLTTRTFLDLNRYAVSDREDFYSPMLVNNPVAPYTARNGLGVYFQHLGEAGYATMMLREADGTSSGLDFSTLGSGNWEYALELALTPDNLAGLGQGYYRVIGYYTDSTGSGMDHSPDGWSLSLSFDQDIGEHVGTLFRYAYASEDFRDFKQRVAVGLQVKHALGFKYDRIGVGAWWGDPTKPGNHDETGLEVFWKLQLAPYLEVTPDLQIVFNPQDNAEQGTALVAGLRVRLLL